VNRSKIVLAAVAVVFLSVVAALGVFAHAQYAKSAKAKKARDKEFRELEAVFQDEIFPSATNVLALQENVRRLEETRGEMESALRAMNVPAPTNVSASVFMRTLQDLAQKKIKSAPIVEGKKSMPPNFTFGFERYLGASPRMPRENEVPRLVQQLIVVSALVDEMFAAGVSQVTSIHRVRFEAGENPVTESEGEESGGRGRRSRRGGRGASSQEGDADIFAGSVATSIQTDLYSAQHFSIRFAARQGVLVELLNRLARLKYFVVVTDVRMHKMGLDIRIPGALENKDAPRGGRRGQRGGEESEESVDAAPVMSDLPPSQRLMSGPDIDPPLDVTIELDVYQFEKKAEAE
jgi:hypothetical protein